MATSAQDHASKVTSLLDQGQFARAAKTAKLAFKKFPKEPYFANLAGMALAQSGNEREAAMFFHKALRFHPDNEGIQNNLVQALVVSEQHEKAQNLIEKLLPKRKELSEILYLKAMSLMMLAKHDLALPAALESVEVAPTHVKAQTLCGNLLNELARYKEAIEHYVKSRELAPNGVDSLAGISEAYAQLGRNDEALAALEEAISINPSSLDARHKHAVLLNQMGRKDEAKQAYHTLLDLEPDQGDALRNLSLLQSADENAQLLPAVMASLSRAAKNAASRADLNFALANIFWQQADFEKAGKALKLANGQTMRSRPFDAAYEAAQKQSIFKMFPKASASGSVKDDGPTPIFVIGLPRSGTTLVEQILTAHSDITGFGELSSAGNLALPIIDDTQAFDADLFAENYRNLLPDDPQKSPMFVDKMPANYKSVGFLAAAFPTARFVCLRRDPRDVALSMWRSYFPGQGLNFTFDLEAVAQVANDFSEYMAHWRGQYSDRILDVKYEDIVTDIEAQSKALAQFCGVEWQAEMTRPDKNKAAVRTASLLQVRQKVHARSVGGWRQIADQMQPLVQGLDKAYWPDLD